MAGHDAPSALPFPSRTAGRNMRSVHAVLATRPSFADLALEGLRQWPDLEACDVDGGAGAGLAVGARHIGRLRRSGEAQLRLTWPVIERLSAAPTGSGRVWFIPGSDWIRLRLESDSDVRLLLPLVSLAIQVHTRASHQPRAVAAASR